MRRAIFVLFCGATFCACASSFPSNFEYTTSLRGEQGFIGLGERTAAGQALLDGGVVTDPALALRAAFPDAEVKLRKWGLRYFDKNWSRYQLVLEADILRGADKIKCREVSPDTPVGAPTLTELTQNKGAELQRGLEALTQACIKTLKQK